MPVNTRRERLRRGRLGCRGRLLHLSRRVQPLLEEGAQVAVRVALGASRRRPAGPLRWLAVQAVDGAFRAADAIEGRTGKPSPLAGAARALAGR